MTDLTISRSSRSSRTTARGEAAGTWKPSAGTVPARPNDRPASVRRIRLSGVSHHAHAAMPISAAPTHAHAAARVTS